MQKAKDYRVMGVPLLAAALALPIMGSGCSAEDLAAQGNCEATAEGKAFVTAVTDLEAAAVRIKGKVAAACRDIAVAGGKTTQWNGSGTPTDDQVEEACNVAVTVIGEVKAAGTFSVVVTGGKCEANVSLQAECTAQCDASGSCTADVEAYCDPGNLSVQCQGECAVGAKCEGTPTVAVECSGACTGECEGTVTGGCEGTCSGTCEGTCNGTCDGQNSTGTCAGTCEGSCSATCTGTCTKPAASASCSGQCKGSCTITGEPIQCSGTAKCTGGCTGEYTAPSCTGEVKANCEAKAECTGSCQASAQAKATCTPPTVEIEAAASVDAALVTALSEGLADLFLVAEAEGKLVADVLVRVTGGIQAAISGSAACALKLQGFVEASASVSVSVEASASATGEASTS